MACIVLIKNLKKYPSIKLAFRPITQDERDWGIILVGQYYTDISCILKTIQRRIILEN